MVKNLFLKTEGSTYPKKIGEIRALWALLIVLVMQNSPSAPLNKTNILTPAHHSCAKEQLLPPAKVTTTSSNHQ